MERMIGRISQRNPDEPGSDPTDDQTPNEVLGNADAETVVMETR